ncbi:tetratricopeptide repeat protein [Lentzea sp. BCCO 10_0061]|uniref:Tetratricopeptide repeat protein n=1 Tax=Lentzea sokolovensis TaxID=3095429 RepID=A0ABU4UNX2_9PSEU|nr:tetratricopeptide repeat protein [Lentzea sp. BCCO 10_0061]MDX8141206.1 tetratricopeptide repeat protein [Lentzea sp. BCCO 10_0061]
MTDEFAGAVRRFRLRAGLTQEALAERSGISVSTIRGMETGKRRNPQLASVRQLAAALALRPQEQEDLLSAASAEPAPTPRQLPPELAGFVGRGDALGRLDAVLDGGATSTVVISAISGTAGIGKTTLALHWAHRVADRFPDGQLYADLRGFDPSGAVMAPGEALRAFLEALNVPSRSVPDDVEAQAAKFRTLMAGRAMLVVLDNARDAAQVRPLLPGTPGSLVVVTSRHDLTGLIATTNARSLPLALLSREEAHALLADRLGAERVDAEPAAVAEIIDRCAGLPLALAVVAARAAHTSFSLTAYAAELGGLDGFGSGDEATDLRAVFACSYLALSPAAARAFRLLGLHPGTEISLAAAASVTGLTSARRVMQELTRAHLIVERTPGRFEFHDLLRAYAAEQVQPDERHDALYRLVAHYRYNAEHARAKEHPGRLAEPTLPDGVVAVAYADVTAARSWLKTETPALLAIVRSDHGFPREVVATVRAIANFLDVGGRLSANVDILHRAIALTRDQGQLVALWKLIARVHTRAGRHAEARVLLDQALEVDLVSGDADALGYTYFGLARLVSVQGGHREALDLVSNALACFQESGNSSAEADALNGVAWCLTMLGEFDEALVRAEQAIAAGEVASAGRLDTLGYVEHHRGNHAEAVQHFQTAIGIAENAGDRYMLAEALTHLGETHEAMGNHDEARETWEQAVEEWDALHSPEADALRTRLAHQV